MDNIRICHELNTNVVFSIYMKCLLKQDTGRTRV